MKVCTFCGCKTDDKSRTCASCGSSAFMYVCPNCQNHFEGAYCPDCGTRFNAIPKTCPNCGTKYFSKACPNCGHIIGNNQNANRYNGRPTLNSYLDASNQNTRVAFVCGLLGLFMLPIPLSIIAIIYANKEKKKGDNSTLNRSAMILGILGLFMGVLMIIVYGIGVIGAIMKG